MRGDPLEYKTQSATQEVNSQGNVSMYVVLRVYKIYFVGDWSNGMIGVSKTFGGSSILSSPAIKNARKLCIYWLLGVFILSRMIKSNQIDDLAKSSKSPAEVTKSNKQWGLAVVSMACVLKMKCVAFVSEKFLIKEK